MLVSFSKAGMASIIVSKGGTVSVIINLSKGGVASMSVSLSK